LGLKYVERYTVNVPIQKLNRTTFGIEMSVCLLLAYRGSELNRTTFGIEIRLNNLNPSSLHQLNRTTFGIEI